jgi:glutamyl-tRNA reductase
VLRDIDDLRGVVDASMGSRLSEVSKVEDIIGEEISSFLDWQQSLDRATEQLVAKFHELLELDDEES